MRKSGDPFEVDPLPKSFYYPTKQRELSEVDRKICLSPDHRKEDHVKSPADKKFLRQTKHIGIHEVPTRENGTTDPDQSSSSKFDESWPSTERAMVSTPEADTDGTEISKTPSSDGKDFLLRALPDSTLARYIQRFRNAPPTSRQERDHKYFDSGKGGEFWWLSSSPPSSSTPKEGTPPDRQLLSPRPSLSPKLKRRAATTASPISKTRSSSSPSKSSLDGLDTKTAELQQRAKMLLEKSESTLDTSSSEVYRPIRRVKQGPSEDWASREAPSQPSLTVPPRQFMDQRIQHLPRPAPPPDEDILYQWRLARKMERAQEQAAKWGPAKGTLSLGSSQPRSIPRPLPQGVFVQQRQELEVSAPSVTPVAPHGTASLPARTQTTFSAPAAVASDQQRISSLMARSQYGITSQPQMSISSEQPSQFAAETSQGTHAPSLEPSPVVTTAQPVISGEVHTLATELDQFESADVPSHMHLSCDILPCPHQRALIEKGWSDQTIKLPVSSPVVETILEELHIAERDTERVQKPHRTVIRESRDETQIQGLTRKRTEDKEGRSTAWPEDYEREELRREKIAKRKTKPKRGLSQEPVTSDMLSGIIGEVVSERLFSTPQSSSSSLTGSDDSQGPQQLQEQGQAPEEDYALDKSSGNEFPDDEVLKMLRQQARHYREQLQQIDNILNQHAAGRPSS